MRPGDPSVDWVMASRNGLSAWTSGSLNQLLISFYIVNLALGNKRLWNYYENKSVKEVHFSILSAKRSPFHSDIMMLYRWVTTSESNYSLSRSCAPHFTIYVFFKSYIKSLGSIVFWDFLMKIDVKSCPNRSKYDHCTTCVNDKTLVTHGSVPFCTRKLRGFVRGYILLLVFIPTPNPGPCFNL